MWHRRNETNTDKKPITGCERQHIHPPPPPPTTTRRFHGEPLLNRVFINCAYNKIVIQLQFICHGKFISITAIDIVYLRRLILSTVDACQRMCFYWAHHHPQHTHPRLLGCLRRGRDYLPNSLLSLGE